MATITINGVEVKSPTKGLKEIVTTTVNSGRNANNVVVGEVVGRDQYKLDGLTWAKLTAEEWSTILKLVKNFFITVRTFDMVNNDWITLKMYIGDRTAEVFLTDPNTGLPTEYIDCKFNIIDCGVIK